MMPIIAVTGDFVKDTSVFTQPDTLDFAPTMFKTTITEAGGLPVIIPTPQIGAPLSQLIDQYVATIDGLVLPGGPDVDPLRYDQEPTAWLKMTEPERDAFEIAFVRAMVAANKPVMGVCRGCHVINVAFGGTLYQDLTHECEFATLAHLQTTSGQWPTHYVTVNSLSRLSTLIEPAFRVNSRHHQAVRDVGRGLRWSAKATDGVIEAIECVNSDLVMGFQWHPENMWQQFPQQLNIYLEFISRAVAHKQTNVTTKA